MQIILCFYKLFSPPIDKIANFSYNKHDSLTKQPAEGGISKTMASFIQHKTIRLKSRQDGLPLDVLILSPDSPRGILQLSHGMCEHKERYLPFMEYMADQGFICIIHDHRGHGKSVRSTQDLGYFYENGGPALVKDLYQISCFIRKRRPDLPFFLFGHSMGSLAVRVYLKHYASALDGLIVCGSPSYTPAAKPGLALVSLLSAMQGGRSHSPLVDRMFTLFDLPFYKEHISHAWICTDRKVVEQFNASKYCNFTFTLNGYQALLWLLIHTYDKRGWKTIKPELPILFLSGSQDPCMISKKQFRRAVLFLGSVGYRNVTGHLYSGMRHEILNEPGRKYVYQDIAAFLDQIISL